MTGSDGSDPDCPRCGSSDTYNLGQAQDGSLTYRCRACDRGFNEKMCDGSGPDLADGYGIEIDGVRVAWVKDGTYHFSPPPEDSSVDVEFHGAVPIAELEQLADEWEQKYQEYLDHERQNGPEYVKCANALRSLIADYGGTDE